MLKHKLDSELEEDNLNSKKLHIGVELSTPQPTQNTLMDDMLSNHPTPGEVNSLEYAASTSITSDSADLGIETEDDSSAAESESEPSDTISSASTSSVMLEEVALNDKPKTILDRLPNELLRDIYLRLEAPAMLAFKLVSKAAYSITLDRDGRELVNLVSEARGDCEMGDDFAEMMIEIEADVPSTMPLERLTCAWWCHATLPHAPAGTKRDSSKVGWTQNGFPDEHFDRKMQSRACLACLDEMEDEQEDFHIHGVRFRRCTHPECEWGRIHEGPIERPSQQVLREFFKDPDEPRQSNILIYQTQSFIPSEICSGCFFMETRRDIMEYLNTIVK